jgi:hypothetical protein
MAFDQPFEMRAAERQSRVGERRAREQEMEMAVSGREIRTSVVAAALFALACALGPRVGFAADKVTFVTDFGYNGRHAYYFVALEKGYYA